MVEREREGYKVGNSRLREAVKKSSKIANNHLENRVYMPMMLDFQRSDKKRFYVRATGAVFHVGHVSMWRHLNSRPLLFTQLTNLNAIQSSTRSHLLRDQQHHTQLKRISRRTHGKRLRVVLCTQNSFSILALYKFFLLYWVEDFVFNMRWRRRMTTLVVEVYEAINNVLRNQGKVAPWK